MYAPIIAGTHQGNCGQYGAGITRFSGFTPAVEPDTVVDTKPYSCHKELELRPSTAAPRFQPPQQVTSQQRCNAFPCPLLTCIFSCVCTRACVTRKPENLNAKTSTCKTHFLASKLTIAPVLCAIVSYWGGKCAKRMFAHRLVRNWELVLQSGARQSQIFYFIFPPHFFLWAAQMGSP